MFLIKLQANRTFHIRFQFISRIAMHIIYVNRGCQGVCYKITISLFLYQSLLIKTYLRIHMYVTRTFTLE